MTCCGNSNQVDKNLDNQSKPLLKQYKFSADKHKFLILGESSVGKTCLLNRYSLNQFSEINSPTIGMDYHEVTIPKSKLKLAYNPSYQSIKIQFWDTAGQERFRSITKLYYRGASAIIIVYTMNDEDSIKGLNYYYKTVKDLLENRIPILLVENKTDLHRVSVGSNHLGKIIIKIFLDLENYNYIMHYRVSAKTGYNVNQMMTDFSSFVCNFYESENAENLLKNEEKFNAEFERVYDKIRGAFELCTFKERIVNKNGEELQKLKNEINEEAKILENKVNKIDSEKISKNEISPLYLKLNSEISENKNLFDYYTSLEDKLFITLIESYNHISEKSLVNTSSIKISFLNALINLIPIVGKYLGSALEKGYSVNKSYTLKEQASKFKIFLGSKHSIREYSIKKGAEIITFNKKEEIKDINSNLEIKHWKKQGLIQQFKDLFVFNADKNTFISNYQILGCIDALKIINHIFNFSETTTLCNENQEKENINDNVKSDDVINFEQKISDEIVEKLINIPKKYKFTPTHELIEEENHKKETKEINFLETDFDEDLVLIPKTIEEHKIKENKFSEVETILCKCCCIQIVK